LMSRCARNSKHWPRPSSGWIACANVAAANPAMD
jgi:hypothetical protein